MMMRVLTEHLAVQVCAGYRAEQRAAKQHQAEQREVQRCMERMLSHVEAKERIIDHEVTLVSYGARCLCVVLVHSA